MKNCLASGTAVGDTGFEYTLSLIAGKYKLLLLYWLAYCEVARYSDLKRRIGAISHKSLSLSLKELEADALLVRTEYPQVPPKVEYRLSARGRSLIPILQAMCAWGVENRPH